ncbi:MAG TPA: PEP-CTERM sorting domain-containing protein [Phycisphaerae bacterium]|nr:PEP-CTERM sorting domain-containing protein [Phycisphaerae bacterium]
MKIVVVVAWASLVCMGAGSTRGAALTPGDILLSTGQLGAPSAVYEYTPGGTLVQTFPVTAPGPVDTAGRGVSVGSDGQIYLYDGTFSPALTVINPLTGALQSYRGIGFSTANNLTYGGVAAVGNYAFVSDMNTGGSPDTGIVRFNVTDFTSERFASGTEFERVTLGEDGLLYGLNGDGFSGWPELYVWNPQTMELLRTVGLVGADIRAVAVAADGEIYTTALDGYIREFTPDGTLVKTLQSKDDGYDIALLPSGAIVASAWGTVVVTDTSLNSYSEWSIPTGPLFVASATSPVPEPATLLPAALGAVGILVSRRRRRNSEMRVFPQRS